MFTKFIDNLKAQQTQQKITLADSAIKPMAAGTMDDSAIVAPLAQDPPKRRWSYVTFLNEGTLHGDGDNLVVGL